MPVHAPGFGAHRRVRCAGSGGRRGGAGSGRGARTRCRANARRRRSSTSPRTINEPPPLSLVDKEVKDKGIQGARIALEEDNRTGRLLGQHYDLLEVLLGQNGNPADKAKELLAEGHSLIVADLEAADLLAVADLPDRQGRAHLRCAHQRRRAAPGAVSRQRVPHRAELGDARRRAGAIPAVEEVAALGSRRRQVAGRSGIRGSRTPRRGALRRQDRRRGAVCLRSGIAAHRHRAPADPVADADADAGRSRSRRGRWWRTSPTCSATTCCFAPPSPAPSSARTGWSPSPGTARSRSTPARRCRTVSRRKAGRIMPERDYTAWLAVRIIGEAVTRTSAERSPDAAHLHHVGQIRGGRLQGPGHELPPLGSAAAPAHPHSRAARARFDLAAGRLPASQVPHRHARLRPAGNKVPATGRRIRMGSE